MTTKIEPHKSSIGPDANIMVIIIYIGTAVISWIPFLKYVAWAFPLVIFFMEKDSKFVKYQSVQALVLGIIQTVISIFFSIIIWALTPKSYNTLEDIFRRNNMGSIMVVGVIGSLVSLAITALMVYVLVNAYNYKQVELPIIGSVAQKLSSKMDTIQKEKSNPTADTGSNNNSPDAGNNKQG